MFKLSYPTSWWSRRCGARRGFSLTELAIVLSVIGIILSAIWVSVTTGRQSAKISQATEEITEIVANMRAAYAGQMFVWYGTETVIPYLTRIGSLPAEITRTTPQTTCNTVSGNYADHPWGNSSQDACGTLHICAWTSGTTTSCSSPPAKSAVFAVEFAYLDYGTCASLSNAVSPTAPAGLLDIFINGASSLQFNNQIVPTSSFTSTNCVSGSNGNVVDFVYSLRAPST